SCAEVSCGAPLDPHPQVQPYSYVNSIDVDEVRWVRDACTNTLRGSACRRGRLSPISADPLVTSASRGVTTRAGSSHVRVEGPRRAAVGNPENQFCWSGVSPHWRVTAGSAPRAPVFTAPPPPGPGVQARGTRPIRKNSSFGGMAAQCASRLDSAKNDT